MYKKINIKTVRELAKLGFTCSQIANSLEVQRQSISICCLRNAIVLSKKKIIKLSIADIEDINNIYAYKNKKRAIKRIYRKYGYNIDTVIIVQELLTNKDCSKLRWEYNRAMALSKQDKRQRRYEWCKLMYTKQVENATA